MSVCTFLAADVPLTAAAPLQDDPAAGEPGKAVLDAGGPDGLYPFADVRDYTDKRYGAYLEWEDTADRAQQVMAWIQNILRHTASVELWHVWLMGYDEWEERPVIHRQAIALDKLTPQLIRELAEAEIWNTPDRRYPDRPSFYCLEIRRC